MTKTTFATLEDHHAAMKVWHIVDASEHILGRMAARIAVVLMGKHLPTYTPHMLVGEGVVVTNASQLKVTGNKMAAHKHRYYTGYIDGLKELTWAEMLEKNPEQIVTLAVKRMLPKNRLGKRMLQRLKVYSGAEHPHVAQKPQPLKV